MAQAMAVVGVTRSELLVSGGKKLIVAVDGPAGSGKSSICAKVCDKIGWTYVNTGYLYRSVAYLAQQAGADLSQEAALLEFVDKFARNYRWDPVAGRLQIGDEDITEVIQSREVGVLASAIAKLPAVRDALLPIQRELSLMSPKGSFVDGRDIGTVVFPEADLKIFLTASLEERAKRRQAQLAIPADAAEASSELIKIQDEIRKRDSQDASRQVAPLRQADDAVVLDTSAMPVDQVVAQILEILKDHKLIQ